MLSDEEERRFEHITRNIGLSNAGKPMPEIDKNVRITVLLVLLLLIGFSGLIASVYFKNIFAGAAGFIVILISVYRMSLNVFSGR